MSLIVFIYDKNSAIEQDWQQVLQQQLPNETILLPEQISDAQAHEVEVAIMTNPDASVLKRFTNLVWIHSLWAGVDKVLNTLPLDHVKLVRLVDPALADAMAEAVLGWVLYLQRNMPEYAQQQSQHRWRQLPYVGPQQTRVSVAGAGKLGMAALKTLAPFGYQLNCWSRHAKSIDKVQSYSGEQGLTQMLAHTDILVCLLPSTPQTRRLLNHANLSLLPQGAKVINFARGAVLAVDDLIDLLDSDHLNHAVLDVFDHEPLEPQSPLWDHPKLTILPHISAPTNIHTGAKVVAENINRYRQDAIIPEAVDVAKGY